MPGYVSVEGKTGQGARVALGDVNSLHSVSGGPSTLLGSSGVRELPDLCSPGGGP